MQKLIARLGLSVTRYYALLFGVTYLCYLVFFATVLRHRSSAFEFEFSTVVMPIVELAFFYAIGMVAWQFRHGRLAIPALLVFVSMPLLVMAIYLSQAFSGYISGDYITVVALENISEAEFLDRSPLIGPGVAVAVSWLILLATCIYTRTLHPRQPFGWLKIGTMTFVVLLFAGMFHSRSRPDSIVSLRPDLAPVTSLARKVEVLYDRMSEPDEAGLKLETLVAGLKVPGIDADQDFPFLKDSVYTSDLPFAKTPLYLDNPNIIIIFTEGLSARWMATYGSKYPDLTPNLDRFAKQTMVVRNYYNHTAPTFRGIKGQLSSGYPRFDSQEGAWLNDSAASTQIQYPTLTNMFNDRGYRSVFFSPQTEEDHFNDMLRALGFDNVYTYFTLPELFDGKPLRQSTGTTAATDRDLFAGFITWLRRQEGATGSAPFFACLYNIGTHAFLDTDAEGAKYGDGTNIALNRVRNYDEQIGPLLDYFLTSPLADNTIFIFTTDHATYYEPPVADALQADDYKPYFVDQIPLMVYNKGLALPPEFDANFRTSVDFAPTLLHMLSLNGIKNAFMGFSLFDPVPDYYSGVSSMGEDFYQVTKSGVIKAAEVSPSDPNYAAYVDYVMTYWQLEVLNRIFPAPPGKTASTP